MLRQFASKKERLERYPRAEYPPFEIKGYRRPLHCPLCGCILAEEGEDPDMLACLICGLRVISKLTGADRFRRGGK